MTAQAIIQALGGRWHGTYGTARCPAHDDRTPSLKVRDDPNKRDGIDADHPSLRPGDLSRNVTSNPARFIA